MSWRLTKLTLIALAVLMFLSALAFGVRAPAPEQPVQSNRAATTAIARANEDAATRRDSARPSVARAAKASPDPAIREALRRDIVRALDRRGVPHTPAANHDDAAPRRDDAPAPSVGLANHVGGHASLLQRLNEDFLPLADECIEAARERDPQLHGVVALAVELLAEQDIGAIVEDAQPAPENVVADPELLECLQQTLLSIALPGDAVDGREGFMISLRTEP